MWSPARCVSYRGGVWHHLQPHRRELQCEGFPSLGNDNDGSILLLLLLLPLLPLLLLRAAFVWHRAERLQSHWRLFRRGMMMTTLISWYSSFVLHSRSCILRECKTDRNHSRFSIIFWETDIKKKHTIDGNHTFLYTCVFLSAEMQDDWPELSVPHCRLLFSQETRCIE